MILVGSCSEQGRGTDRLSSHLLLWHERRISSLLLLAGDNVNTARLISLVFQAWAMSTPAEKHITFSVK